MAKKTPPKREPPHARGYCKGCGGQRTLVTAKNLKDPAFRGPDGKPAPAKYVSCPGDCDGNTRCDLSAGPREV